MRIIVLFNLKSGADAESYEQWARSTEIPNVRILGSVRDFQVYRVPGLFGSHADAPYRYAQVLDIGVMDEFTRDMERDAMQRAMREFEGFSDDAVFLLTEALDA